MLPLTTVYHYSLVPASAFHMGVARRRLLNEPLDRPTLSTKTVSIAMIVLGVAGISLLQRLYRTSCHPHANDCRKGA